MADGRRLEVMSYRYGDFDIERRADEAWAATTDGMALTVSGWLEHEPRPSERTEDFIARARFPSVTDAVAAVEGFYQALT